MRAVLLVAAIALPAIVAAAAAPGPPPPGEGERAFQKCYSCHSLEAGRNDVDGPTLNGIVGRALAAEPGFEYSPALRQFARTNPRWTQDLLDRFVADPEAVVPGTTMAFGGVRDAGERAALLDYLRCGKTAAE